MKHILLMAFLFLFAGWKVQGQSLQYYIEKGLLSNQQLQVKNANYEVALQVLEEAKRKRSLRVDFVPTYTLAAGGRTIDVPVGDLLNPVYGTLNQLTASNQFPQIQNESELLNPNNFYDLKLRATYPLYNPTINVNKEIKALEVQLSEYGIDLYKRQLETEITEAYYDVQMSTNAVQLLKEAMTLVRESVRVNRGLYTNGKVLKIDVDAAVNDSVQLKKDIDNASIARTKAVAFLNFLVNEKLTAPVEEMDSIFLPEIPSLTQAGQRTEIAQLDVVESIHHQLKKLEKTQAGPQVNAFLDAGIQDFDFNVDSSSPYLLGGLSMNLSVLDGGQKQARIQVVEAQVMEIQKQRSALQEQIALEQFVASQTIRSTQNALDAAQREIQLHQRQYENQIQFYKIGKVRYLSLQEARTKLIQSNLQFNVLRFQLWKEVAAFKKSLAINL